MKKRILLVLAVLLICIGMFVIIRIASGILLPTGKGGLQVTSNIKAQVFLNERPIGATPLCFCNPNQTIAAKDYNLKIVPDDKSAQPFVAKITINPGVLTAVDRVFLPGALASSYVLTLEKINNSSPQLFISSVPNGALILIDGESHGVSPLDLKSISASEHEVEIQKPGFSKKTVRVRAVPNYRLVLNTILGAQGDINDTEPTLTISSEPTTAITETPAETVLILQTPTGFLRVRASASTTGAEIGRVNPGDTLPFVSESGEWYEVTLTTGENGWVSKTYAEKQTTQ